jgi:hypothetical protein
VIAGGAPSEVIELGDDRLGHRVVGRRRTGELVEDVLDGVEPNGHGQREAILGVVVVERHTDRLPASWDAPDEGGRTLVEAKAVVAQQGAQAVVDERLNLGGFHRLFLAVRSPSPWRDAGGLARTGTTFRVRR